MAKTRKPKKMPQASQVELNETQAETVAAAYRLAVALDQQKAAAYRHLNDLCGVLAGDGYTLVPVNGGQSVELYRKP